MEHRRDYCCEICICSANLHLGNDNVVKGLANWLFRNRVTGDITIAQFPNLALGCYLALVLIGRLTAESSVVGRTVGWLQGVTLGWWALDEVFRGVNPWRRLLGVGGCVAATLALIAQLNA
jgi:hypothetical protein